MVISDSTRSPDGVDENRAIHLRQVRGVSLLNIFNVRAFNVITFERLTLKRYSVKASFFHDLYSLIIDNQLVR